MPQVNYTSDGGYKTFSAYSGVVANADTLIFSGAGRLNQVLAHTQLQSGLAVTFYDSAVATSGGPFALSGHIILGVIPPTYPNSLVVSGFLPFPWNAQPYKLGMPFRSGLCVHVSSGVPGYSVSYTPEINQF